MNEDICNQRSVMQDVLRQLYIIYEARDSAFVFMHPGLKYSEVGDAEGVAIDHLQDAISNLESAIEALGNF